MLTKAVIASPLAPAATALTRRPKASVAPDSGRAGENPPSPVRTAETIWPPETQITPELPASSMASRGCPEFSASLVWLGLHAPVANGALRSAKAT